MCFCRSNAFFFKVYGVTIWASKETECINISRAQIKEIRIPTIWIPTTKIIFNLLMFSQWLRSAGSATIKDHSPPLTPSITVVKREMSRPMTKPTTWHVRPANTQISLGIRPVWSESSLCAWRNLEFLATHWAHSEDSDQAGRMPRLIWVFAGRTCHFVGFVMRRLKSQLQGWHSDPLPFVKSQTERD